MIDLPRDANGRMIPLDTKVLYDECGNELTVSRYCCSVRQRIRERVWEAVMLNALTYYTSRLYITPPDSWEKLEEDLNRGSDICDYYEDCPMEMYGKSCSECKKAALKNIASRIRKLRGEGE